MCILDGNKFLVEFSNDWLKYLNLESWNNIASKNFSNGEWRDIPKLQQAWARVRFYTSKIPYTQPRQSNGSVHDKLPSTTPMGGSLNMLLSGRTRSFTNLTAKLHLILSNPVEYQHVRVRYSLHVVQYCMHQYPHDVCSCPHPFFSYESSEMLLMNPPKCYLWILRNLSQILAWMVRRKISDSSLWMEPIFSPSIPLLCLHSCNGRFLTKTS